MNVEHRPFEAPPILIGAWQLSAGHQSDPRAAEELFEDFTRIADAGLRTFDCADIYTGVEAFLGEFLRRYRNERGVEAGESLRFHTKYVPDFDALGTVGRSDVEAIVDRSLSRLGVDRLDLVQFAWWDYSVPRYVEVAGWLNELREAGKIRHLGATNFDVIRLGEILDAGIPIAAHQVQFSALDHRPEFAPPAGLSVTDLAARHDMQLLCYGGLAGGFLSDRWLGAEEPTPPFANRSLVKYRLVIEEFGGWSAYQELLELLRRIADAHDASVAQVALAYALTRPSVAGMIVGASRPERMIEAAGAARLELSSNQIDSIRDRARRAPGPRGTVFGLERNRDGPHGRIMKYDLNRDA